MRRLIVLAMACSFLLGCGSSGSSGSGNSSGNVTPSTPTRKPTITPGGPTRTPRPTETPGGPTRTITQTRTPQPPQTLFVRASGSDDNPGTSPDQAFKTLTTAASHLHAGTTLYVGPGKYTGRLEITKTEGSAAAPIVIIADTTGSHTGDRSGAVIIDANGDTAALLMTKSTYVTLDGFTITGAQPQETPKASATAVHVRSASAHVTIQHCIIANAATADGIRVEASSDALIFNNLIYANDRGILISGDSPRAQVINNTVADNERTGILLLQKSQLAPVDGTVMNNIIQQNGNGRAIQVDDGPPSAEEGYQGNFNLVFEPDAMDQTTAYLPTTVRGPNDVNADAQFVNLDQGDVHLDPASPALNAGSDDIDAGLLEELQKRSTSADGARDRSPVDLGYHYPQQ